MMASLPIRRSIFLSGVIALLSIGLAACGRQPFGEMPGSPAGRPVAAKPGPLRFRDVATSAGIIFRHTSGALATTRFPETMGSGCAFLDYDNDGRVDVFFVNSRVMPSEQSPPAPNSGGTGGVPTCRLYHNNGDGTFRDVTNGSGLEQSLFGMGVAVGDFDNDGRDDIYVTAALDGSRLWHNLGNGRFEDIAEAAGVRNADRWGTSAAWLDFDRDGKLDLFVCNYVRYRWGDETRIKDPSGRQTQYSPIMFPPETCRLYRNRGSGRFQDVSTQTGIQSVTGKALGVVTLDYDDDAWPDIAVACDNSRNLLFHNEHGHFREDAVAMGFAFGESGTERAGMGIDAADIWNDGRIAVMVSNFSNEGLSLFTQSRTGSAFLDTSAGSGTYAPSRLLLGFGLAFLRWLAAILSWMACGVGCLIVAFREDKRALHDLLVGTKVIYRR